MKSRVPIALATRLSPDEIAERVGASRRTENLLRLRFEADSIKASVVGKIVEIPLRLKLTLVPGEDGGTLVRGDIGPSIPVAVAMVGVSVAVTPLALLLGAAWFLLPLGALSTTFMAWRRSVRTLNDVAEGVADDLKRVLSSKPKRAESKRRKRT